MKLAVELRKSTGKSITRKLKAKNMMPGIIYGGAEPIKITVEERMFKRLMQTHHSSKRPIEVEIGSDADKLTKSVILQDYQREIVKDKYIHVDFREVTKDTVLEVNLPIQTVGTPKAVKLGGVLQVIRHEIPVKCKVGDIVDFLEVDTSAMDFGESIHVLDITYPEGITPVVTGRNFTLMTISGSAGNAAEENETAEAKEE